MSYEHYASMSSLGKDELVNGIEMQNLTDEYMHVGHQHNSSSEMNTESTPKRRYQDKETDMINTDNNMFQMAKKKGKFEKNRPTNNSDDHHTICKNLYSTNPTSDQGQQGQKHPIEGNSGRRIMIIICVKNSTWSEQGYK